MIRIQTYIKINSEFHPITEITRKPFDSDLYFEGFMDINYNGKPILNERHWDLVDQLWVYFSKAFEEANDRGLSQFYFPDQPLKVTVKFKGNGFINITIDDSPKIVFECKKDSLLFAMREACSQFVKWFAYFYPHRSRYVYTGCRWLLNYKSKSSY